MRNLLLIAYHFPPLVGSSGIQRSLRFAQYLPEFGWRPTVLTVSPRAYEQADPSTIAQIPAGCRVIRVPCLDTARHLAIAGRYPGGLAVPDRWASWTWLGTGIGVRACRRHAIDAIWSTYPIASAHLLGARVQRRTGLPWVADFRDPMAQEGYPADPRRWQAYRTIEETAAAAASRLVFVTPSAARTYRELFPATPPERFVVIENGYDEGSFASAPAAPARLPEPGEPLVLLHSGVVYPSERDPTALLQALASLRDETGLTTAQLRLRFRASAHDAMLEEIASRFGVRDFIELEPPIPYREALAEMQSAHALLVMQGRNCNEQIPAKVYEYLRAGRPILGLADPKGDTGQTLLDNGCSQVAALEDTAAIAAALREFVTALREGRTAREPAPDVQRFSRRNLTARLASLLDQCVEERAGR